MRTRKAILFFAFVCGTSCLGWCDTCGVGPLAEGSLAAYQAAGSCTIGNLTYSDFQYTGTGTGADAITDGEVTVVPEMGEIVFKASWDVGAGQSLGSDISYVVSGDNAVITGLKLTLGGWGFFEGGTLSVTDTGSDSATRLAEFGGISVTENQTFGPVNSFSFVEDISLAGNNGGASLSYTAQEWTTASTVTPEPPTMLLAGVALVGIAILVRLRHAKRQESQSNLTLP